MPSQEYWQERAELRAIKAYDKADNSYKDLQLLYKQASDSIDKDISHFYTKYGKNIQSPTFKTLSDGTKVISGSSTKLVVPANEAYKYKRLESLKSQLNQTLSELAKNQDKYMTTELRLLAQDSYNSFYFDTFQGYGVGFDFDLLDPKAINQLSKNKIQGLTYGDRIIENSRKYKNATYQELVNGLTQGIGTKEMTKRLANKTSLAYRVAETLMRTEITNTYNQATLQGYKSSGIVIEYEYLATLDNRTSDICQALDGKVFKVKNAIVGLNYPPMHPRCRSTTLSKFDDEVFERRARDPKTGKTYTVPSDMSYFEWAKIYL